MIRMLAEEPMQPRISAIDPDDPAAQARVTHEPLDPSSAHATALTPERVIHARTAIGSVSRHEDGTNLFE